MQHQEDAKHYQDEVEKERGQEERLQELADE